MVQQLDKCMICGSTEAVEVLAHGFSMSSDREVQQEPLSKIECQKCGALRTASIDLNVHYANYDLAQDPIFFYEGEKFTRSQLNYDWINSLISLKPNSKILEIGCGCGQLIEKFKNFRASGIEPDLQSFEKARRVCSVRNISYDSLSDDEEYDIVLASYVIEHLFDPNRFLKKVSNILKADGLLILSLPSQECLSHDIYFIDHLYHFTHNQFKHLLGSNGFEVFVSSISYKCVGDAAYYIAKKINFSSKNFKNELSFEQNRNVLEMKNQLERLGTFLISDERKKVCFGYGETSKFFQIYSKLLNFVNVFIDDFVESENVLTVEEALSSGILEDSVLIILSNPMYVEHIKKLFRPVKNLDVFVL